jgi:hypothetical protein
MFTIKYNVNMRINKFIILNKKLVLQIILAIFYIFSSPNIYAQGFVDEWTTNTLIASTTSEQKPQSKVWKYGGYWWAIIPVFADGGDPAGTYLWRLDNTSLTKLIKLSDSINLQADVKAIGDTTHIILQHTYNLQPRYALLVSIQFVPGSPPTYILWPKRDTTVTIILDSGQEAATIDVDSKWRMWLASDGSSTVNVRWSDSPYSNWNGPHTIGTGVTNDDICAVTAFGGNKIGVLWSNQNTRRFRFIYHNDSNPDATDWEVEENAAGSGNQNDPLADDHINLAVGNDGTIYAAVKTSYDQVNEATIALLERKPNPVDWNFYGVQNGIGTRPIALIEEKAGNNTIFVLYTELGGGDILYKYSSTGSIDFSSAPILLIDPTQGQDLTSTKQNFTNEVFILFGLDGVSGEQWRGAIAGTEPLPVELALFDANVMEDRILLKWRTETEVNNYGFKVERILENSYWKTLGFVEGHGNSNSPKEYSFADYDISQAGQYKYRLKQIDNDGKFEYSYVITLYVGAPAVFYLSQNYPNPFNPSTRIDYSVPQASKVSLKVYDMLGREVASLVDEYKEIGTYTVTFDASNLAGGIYLYVISAGDFMQSKKMTYLK